MPAEGKTVGSANVRILPDTSKFSTSLKKFLERVERTSQVSVTVDADTRAAAAQIQAISRNQTTTVKVAPDTTGFTERVSTVTARQAPARVRVEADTTVAQARLAELTATNRVARLKVDADISAARRTLAELQARGGGEVDVRVDAQTALAQAKLDALVARQRTVDIHANVQDAAAKAQLALLSRDRRSTVHVDVDRGGISAAVGFATGMLGTLGRIGSVIGGMISNAMSQGTQAITETGSAATKSVSSFSQAGAGVGGLIGAVVQLAATATLAIVGIGALGSAIIVLGNAAIVAVQGIALLPGILAVLGGALATVIVGFSGVGDAMSKMGGDTNAFNEALAKLTPNAQAFVLAINAQRDAWNGVKFAVQDALFANMAPAITTLANNYLPLLKTGMTGIADSINYVIIKIIDMLNTSAMMTTVGQLFDAIQGTVRNLGAALAPLIGAFLEIATVAAQVFEVNTRGAATAAQSFADWIHSVASNGKLFAWMDQVWQTLKIIWNTVKELGKIFYNVFTSMMEGLTGESNPKDQFQVILDKVKEFSNWTASHEGDKFFREMGEAVAWCATVAENLARAMKVLWDVLSAIAGVVKGASTGLANLGGKMAGVDMSAEGMAKTLTGTQGSMNEAGIDATNFGTALGTLPGAFAGAASGAGAFQAIPQAIDTYGGQAVVGAQGTAQGIAGAFDGADWVGKGAGVMQGVAGGMNTNMWAPAAASGQASLNAAAAFATDPWAGAGALAIGQTGAGMWAGAPAATGAAFGVAAQAAGVFSSDPWLGAGVGAMNQTGAGIWAGAPAPVGAAFGAGTQAAGAFSSDPWVGAGAGAMGQAGAAIGANAPVPAGAAFNAATQAAGAFAGTPWAPSGFSAMASAAAGIGANLFAPANAAGQAGSAGVGAFGASPWEGAGHAAMDRTGSGMFAGAGAPRNAAGAAAFGANQALTAPDFRGTGNNILGITAGGMNESSDRAYKAALKSADSANQALYRPNYRGAGYRVGQEFANGIYDSIPAAVTAAGALTNAVNRYFPHSPAKEGPLSGRGWVSHSGRALMEGFASGIRGASTFVTGAVDTVMRQAVPALGDLGYLEDRFASLRSFDGTNVDVHTSLQTQAEALADALQYVRVEVAAGQVTQVVNDRNLANTRR